MTVRGGSMERWQFLGASAGGRGEETASITISTPALDHYHDRVLPKGMDRSVFDRNPVVLWLHDAYGTTEASGIPVGKATRVTVTPSGITAAWRWLTGDPFVDRVRNAWDQGVLNAASVGFIPTEYAPNKDGGHDISRWKLLEFSLVPIPANPEATRLLRGLGLAGGTHAVVPLLTPEQIDRAVHAGVRSVLGGPAPPLLLTPAQIAAAVRRGAAEGFRR